MNKRQRKKNYKKRYGTNPNKQMKIFEAQLREAVPKMVEVMKKWVDEVVKFINDLPQKVSDMSEEEFQNMLNSPDITIQQKLQLMVWRGKGD